MAEHPAAGRISGVSVDDQATNLALAQFSSSDDVRVYNAAIFEIFGDYDFFYSYYGTDLYDDLTLNSGAGNDTLVFYQPSEAELAYLGLTDIVTGTGEDVVVIDAVALTPGIGAAAWMEGVNISTGDDNDQVLINLTGASSQIIEGGDFVLGGGNDFMSIVMNSGSESETGFSAIVMSDFYLGAGNDELLIDINGKDAVWAQVNADINAGDGDDHVSIDNSDVTMSQTYPYQVSWSADLMVTSIWVREMILWT